MLFRSEIVEARIALECLMAQRAAERFSTSDKNELKRVLREMRAAVRRGDRAAYSDCNRLLHRRIAEISHHGVATALVENLRHRSGAHRFRSALVSDRPAASLTEHVAIVNAIVANDGPGAAVAMATHLQFVIGALRDSDILISRR